MTKESKLWKARRKKALELELTFSNFSAPFEKIRDDKIMDAQVEYEISVCEMRKKLNAELAPFEKAWLDEYTKR